MGLDTDYSRDLHIRNYEAGVGVSLDFAYTSNACIWSQPRPSKGFE